MTETYVDHEAIARTESFIHSLPLDGTPTPLSQSINGKRLVLTARHITFPFTQLGTNAPTQDSKSFLLFNLFGSDTQKTVSVGFMDWAITKDTALCEHQQRYVVPATSYEKLAAKECVTPEKVLQAFLVEKNFQRHGLGEFLIATSLTTLKRLGVTDIYPGTYVTKKAIPRWRSFGIETPDKPHRPFSIPFAATHPQVTRSLATFAPQQ